MDSNEADPGRRVVAAHELGHWLAFTAAGFHAHRPRVIGKGRDVTGYVTVPGDDRDLLTSTEQLRGYIRAVLAGGVAGSRWVTLPTETGYHEPADDDEALARQLLRHPLARDLNRGQLLTEARVFVRQNWTRIERLTPRLARRGRL